jgi:hypothetical protein
MSDQKRQISGSSFRPSTQPRHAIRAGRHFRSNPSPEKKLPFTPVAMRRLLRV